MTQNEFISYLNSLHNIGADGKNALAESQALSPFFGELYEPLPQIDELLRLLVDKQERVLVLTGHAGDGKSTVALDLFKKLRKLPLSEPLAVPLSEIEEISLDEGKVTIVKDMSELSADLRLKRLESAFSNSGNWLIVSNTGPLINSFRDYANQLNIPNDIESEILECLEKPIGSSLGDEHSLTSFDKELVVINLSSFDNVNVGAKLLKNLVQHSGWEKCTDCELISRCPIKTNQRAILENTEIENRIRWIYLKLSAYEQRLTLRQLIAHLSFSITGGLGCSGAREQLKVSNAINADVLEKYAFSENFFGYQRGRPRDEADRIRAVSLIRRSGFGAPVAVDYERALTTDVGMGWGTVPIYFSDLCERWQERALEHGGIRWRFALRRLAYLFGEAREGAALKSDIFFDSFLSSPKLRDFDYWKQSRKLTISKAESRRFLSSCLKVLLEVYSGYTSSQFRSKHDTLFLTLRRPDQAVVQATQLIIESIPFRDFELIYDEKAQLPKIVFGRDLAEFELSLPLLDFFHSRTCGELGNSLSPIHLAQIDWFRAELLEATKGQRHGNEEIELLRAGIDGEVAIHRYLLDEERNTLEQY